MADRKVEVEHWDCFECGQAIEVRILTHDHEEAPNCFNVPAGCFLTCIDVSDEDDEDDGDEEGTEEFVVFCNAKCAGKMLDEYDLPEPAAEEALPQ